MCCILQHIGLYCNISNIVKTIMSIAVRISNKLINEAKVQSRVENRSLTGQIEYWAKIGKISEENPELSYNLIREILIGLEQLESDKRTEYKFG